MFGCNRGSSPRVRSGHRHSRTREGTHGIISACAERTGLWVIGSTGIMGSSPRVRSGPRGEHPPVRHGRIISACAERTKASRSTTTADTDHLRVCGADRIAQLSFFSGWGSSPRVRSGPLARADACYQLGIISACAERTSCSRSARRSTRDHLRVCGADSSFDVSMSSAFGSSPRVRSGLRSAGRRRCC